MFRFSSSKPDGRRRRGFVEPISAVTIAALALTVLNLGSRGLRGQQAFNAADDFRANMAQAAEGMNDILKSKYDRMRRDGQLTEAEYTLAIHRLGQDSSNEVLQRAAQELANRQADLANTAFWELMWDAVKSTLFTGIGEGGGALMGDASTVVPGVPDGQVAGEFVDTISAFDGGLGTLTMLTNPYLVDASQVRAAIEQAEQRIRGGGGPGDARVLLSQRILAFFDKWCVDNQVDRHRNDPNHEDWVRRYRSGFQQRLHAAFEQFVRGELAQEGWEVPAPGLHSAAWHILTTSKAYRDTFGRDYSGVYSFQGDRPDGKGKITYEFTFDDRRDGTAIATFTLPAHIDVRDLPKIGLPATREWQFPLTAKIDRHFARETEFSTTGPELHAAASGWVKFGVGIAEALSNMFGGDARGPSLVEHARAENCSLSLRPVSDESNDLTLSFSGVFLKPERGRGGIELQRENAAFSAQAKRVR